MSENIFDIRDYEYFQNKNIFTGSVKNFRYKIIPSGEIFRVVAWLGKLCLEKSEILDECDFEFTPDGLDKAVEWIEKKYKESFNYT